MNTSVNSSKETQQSFPELNYSTQQEHSLICDQPKPTGSSIRTQMELPLSSAPHPVWYPSSQDKNQQGVKKQEYIWGVTSKDSAPSLYKVAATYLLSELLNMLQSVKNKD